MVDSQKLHLALREFAHTLVRRYEVGDVLYRLSDHVSDVLEVTGCGVSILEDDNRLVFVTATSPLVEEVERLQNQYGEGPCEDAAMNAAPTVIADLGSCTRRWPKYGPTAIERGMRAVLGIPMHVEGTAIGALNVYSTERRDWTDDETAAAQLLADMATTYVVMANQLHSAEQLAGQLQHALNSRVVIEQAKGMLARTHGVDVSQAFERLRRHARNSNRKIHDVADQVVAGTVQI